MAAHTLWFLSNNRQGQVDTRGPRPLQSKPEYGRLENPDWPALEEGWDPGHLFGDAPIHRGPQHHGNYAQVRVGGRGADSGEGRAQLRRPQYSRIFAGAGRREVVGLTWSRTDGRTARNGCSA